MNDTQKETKFILATTVGALAGAVVAGAVSVGLWRFLLPFSSGDASPAVQRGMIQLIEEESATIHVVEQVEPAVASVIVRKPKSQVSSPNTFFLGPFGLVPQTPVPGEGDDELVDVGGGTAFFVTTDGLLLTNRHVVSAEGASFFIKTQEAKEYRVEVVARDTLYDVAVLRALPKEGEALPVFSPATLASSDQLKIGQTVIAIGNAFAEFQNSVTKGIVSGKHRRLVAGDGAGSEVIEEAIQTDAAINPGNSGGPLINLYGEVVGINTAVSSQGQGVGFAIPIHVGRKAVEDVKAFGRIMRPWLGVRYVMLTAENASAYGFAGSARGAYVLPRSQTEQVGVVAGSPAEKGGVKEGDVIKKVNDHVLGEDDTLASVLGAFRPGEKLTLEVLREGNTQTLSITLEELTADKLK
ncbi:trypsin-like peptidase domain-containing protein [Candidatus Uhrbacteria bacterium]|nr:trypsin-like peptidase domain-containing protein [Candidatus Uhrbacteria bacterium]